MAAFLYEFEWDTAKARSNMNKHGVHFGRAATVFLDPAAVTIADEEHGESESRWITMGKTRVAVTSCWSIRLKKASMDGRGSD
jgi:uncharacterized DUF497 family protein